MSSDEGHAGSATAEESGQDFTELLSRDKSWEELQSTLNVVTNFESSELYRKAFLKAKEEYRDRPLRKVSNLEVSRAMMAVLDAQTLEEVRDAWTTYARMQVSRNPSFRVRHLHGKTSFSNLPLNYQVDSKRSTQLRQHLSDLLLQNPAESYRFRDVDGLVYEAALQGLPSDEATFQGTALNEAALDEGGWDDGAIDEAALGVALVFTRSEDQRSPVLADLTRYDRNAIPA
jgi:hypothetical protein